MIVELSLHVCCDSACHTAASTLSPSRSFFHAVETLDVCFHHFYMFKRKRTRMQEHRRKKMVTKCGYDSDDKRP